MSRGYSGTPLWGLSRNSAAAGILFMKISWLPIVRISAFCWTEFHQNRKDPVREIQRFPNLGRNLCKNDKQTTSECHRLSHRTKIIIPRRAFGSSLLYCRLIYMLSGMLHVRLTIKVKVGIPESFKVGWYPHKITGWSHLKRFFHSISLPKSWAWFRALNVLCWM